ncbi:MAG: alpha/beta hydrolase [Kibdelosporangium sp.]
MAAATLLTAPGVHARPGHQAISWAPCQEAPANKEVQCGTLRVPVDWSRADGPAFDVHLARRPAKADRVGTVVYLPGGPGDSGVNRLLGGSPVSDELAARYDVVSLDPRGTNRSSPIKCDAALVAEPANVDPDRGARFADVLAYSGKLGDSCREHTGELIDHVDSRNVARDVEALRTALGQRQVDLYSRSYGTLAAQRYAELFPDRVRTAVLDSVFDHSLTTSEFLETETRTVEDSFNAFADWCDRSTNCALRGQDVGQVFDAVYAKAGRGEIPHPKIPGRALTPFELSVVAMNEFYGPNWQRLSAQLAAWAGGPAVRAESTDAAEPASFPSAVLCADHRFVIRSEQDWSRKWERLKQLAPHMRSHLAWQAVAMCAGWPLPATNPQHTPRIDPSVPVLILNSLHDPATALEWAHNVNRQIRGSVLLTYDGAGHGIYLRNDCTEQVTDRYLLHRVLPAPGTHCPGSDPV